MTILAPGRVGLLAGFIGSTSWTPASAADNPLGAYAQTTTVSDTLALDLLGAPDLKPTKPGSIDAALTDLRAFYKDGSFVPGTAVELNPWAMGMGASTTWREYVSNPLTPVFARSSVSLATTATGSGANQLVFGAAGLRIRLWDDTDWRLNRAVVDCARRQPPAPPAIPPPAGGVTPGPPLSNGETATAKACLAKIAWNASQAALGLGTTASSPGGAMEGTHFGTAAAWLSFGFPIGDRILLLASPRYTYQAHVPASAAAADIPQQHLYGAGLKLTARWANGTVSLEGGAGARTQGSSTEARGLLGISAQFSVNSEAWIELGFSGTIEPNGQSQLLGLSSVKWSFDTKPSD